jgi:hypothetical protein
MALRNIKVAPTAITFRGFERVMAASLVVG